MEQGHATGCSFASLKYLLGFGACSPPPSLGHSNLKHVLGKSFQLQRDEMKESHFSKAKFFFFSKCILRTRRPARGL